ncbi:response regulator [Paenibacillus sp. LHD-38]|uniref:response regulator n=1 Tax=Paenibacillus sp. LHD-38 TaxID=3072143 RepID=UPI00280F5E0C|nr:response regulator [Paenibacillus sp. LHD-38]MDQ8734655.1 response regulator [Paenibacillus sp. LHD-38]
MIRLILADDEPIIIKGLRKLIDWESFGMEIVGQAYDGNELMQLIEELVPDLVISDISMPHRTGIDIIKEIKQRGMPVSVIFISAYQEFSYARDAVAFGAIDYLVKPVVKQQLEGVLDKAITLISEHNEEQKRKGKLQLLERKSRHEEMQDALIQLTDGNLSPNTKSFQETDAQLQGPRYSVLIIEVERLKEETDRWTEKEKKLIEFAIGNVLQEVIIDTGIGYVFMKRYQHVIVVSHDEPEEPVLLAEDMQGKIETFLKLKVSIALSRPVSELIKLADAYREAEQAMEMKYFLGLNRVLSFVPQGQPQSFDKELYNLQWDVIRAMTSKAWPEVQAALAVWLDTIKNETYGNRSLAVSTCFSSVSFIIQELSKSGVPLSERALDKRELQQLLANFETFDQMRSEIIGVFEKTYKEMDSDSGNKDKIVLAKIKQYIDEHYSEEITLESMASMAFMNSYYFSSFFKKHTKQNFKQYVTEVRMRHAADMLSLTDLMVYEIAEKVGYNNARHFSDMFKKMYGKLPIDYRQDTKKTTE